MKFINKRRVFSEREMYPTTRTNLRNRYPTSEGWAIYPLDHHGTYIPDYVIERRLRNRRIIKVVVEVKKCRVTQYDINQLNGYARNLAGPNVGIEAKIFVVASGADTSLVPNDIEVIYLRSFSCSKRV